MYTAEELEEALRAITSTLNKCEKVQPKLKQGSPQYTLLVRRIQAFEVANSLIRQALDKQGKMSTPGSTSPMPKHRIYTTSFASVYPLYIAKVERKGRTKAEVDEIIYWLTGYTRKGLEAQLDKKTDFETFFAKAPKLNPARALITGMICGVRIEEIQDPLMREIRYLDKLIDELAKGKTMQKILRNQ